MNKLAAPLFLGFALLCTQPALADKPSWAGGGKHGNKGEPQQAAPEANRGAADRYGFDDAARRVLRDYYGTQAQAGKCPPGLAKKNNGCLPPGQAKKWAKGQPLPSDLRYGNLPPELLKRLPPPPAKHRYVEVAGDVLLIAIGTSMVIDAVEDLLR